MCAATARWASTGTPVGSVCCTAWPAHRHTGLPGGGAADSIVCSCSPATVPPARPSGPRLALPVAAPPARLASTPGRSLPRGTALVVSTLLAGSSLLPHYLFGWVGRAKAGGSVWSS
eukprot:scaffold49459_cov36-Tisochrysis_lutea.AAC.3